MKASATMRRMGHGWMRWATALGTLAALLAGCAPHGTTAKREPDLAKSQVLRVGVPSGGSSDLATLDPDIVTDADSQMVIDLLYDPLVTLDTHMRVENWGADRVSVSADGRTYTFHIRAGQGFADGTPVTALNYAFSLNRALDPCLASPVSYYLFQIKDAIPFATDQNCQNGIISQPYYPPPSGPIIQTLIGDSITVPDPTTLVVTLAQPGVYFLTALTYPVDAALDPALVGTDRTDLSGERWLDALSQGRGTSGMYRLTSWDHTNGKLVLNPNPHWWGLAAGKKPFLSEIDFSFMPKASDVFGAYQGDTVDLFEVASSLNMFGQPAPSDFSYAQTLRGFHRVPTFTEYALVMDWTKAPYDNLDAREALCLALDRDALNQQLYAGQRLPTWHIVPQGMPGYTPWLTGPDGVTSTKGDPTAARAHWQAYLQTLHGANPPALEFDEPFFDFSGVGPGQQKFAQALAQQWKAVLGITVSPKPFYIGPWDESTSHFALGSFGWQADYPDPQDFLSLLLTAGAQYNVEGINVPEADKLAHQADVTNDPALRDALYNDTEQLYVNAVAWCPLFQGSSGYVARSQVLGWQMDGRGLTPNDAWLATYVAAH